MTMTSRPVRIKSRRLWQDSRGGKKSAPRSENGRSGLEITRF